MAVSFPKAGDMNLRTTPDNPYQRKTERGPYHPTSYDSFLEKRMMSRVGFEKLEYISESELAHF
jgi:hypothetical protein